MCQSNALRAHLNDGRCADDCSTRMRRALFDADYLGRTRNLRVRHWSHHGYCSSCSWFTCGIENRCSSRWLGNALDRASAFASADDRRTSHRILGSACDKSSKRWINRWRKISRGNDCVDSSLSCRTGRSLCSARIFGAPRSW